MSNLLLILRGLLHHRRMHLAVALGVAAGTAVLTGALLVGDSMRGSLRRLTLERLGRIEEVLVVDRFFRQELAEELAATAEFKSHFAEAQPAIYLEGSVENPAAKGVARATILGCSDKFWSLGQSVTDETKQESAATLPPHPAAAPPPVDWLRPAGRQPSPTRGEGRIFGVIKQSPNDVILNAPLAAQLQVKVGDEVLVRFHRRSEIPSEAALGRKTDDALLASRRMTVQAIVPADGLGRFGLRPNQQNPRNAYVSLAAIQNSLDQRGLVNAILVAGRDAAASPPPAADAALPQMLKPQLSDFGLAFEDVELPDGAGRCLSFTSDRMLLPEYVEAAARRAFAEDGVQETLVYLANTIAPDRPADRESKDPAPETPYSTIAALDLTTEPPLGPFLAVDGSPIGPLADDEIALNDWTADDLGVRPGDEIDVSYFEPESTHGQVRETTHKFRLKAIARLSGPAADRHLTPELKGVTDEKSMADWDPPFPYEQRRVREKDETYWDEHRATPKAFVSLAAGRKLWGSRFGQTTSIRIPHRAGMTADSLAEKLQLDPKRLGFIFQPVKRQGLLAAAGTTPFNLLFLGFSFFIIAAAMMLVLLLFRLGVEQRAGEVGILLASGLNQRHVRRLLAAEGLCVAAAGGLLGVVGGVLYAWLLLAGLKTWWLGAITTPFLDLYVTPVSLLIGYASGVLMSFAAVAWALWRMRNSSVRRLLSRQMGDDAARAAPSRWSTLLVRGGIVAALALGLSAMFLSGEAQAGAFFGAGFLVLLSSWAYIGRRLRLGGNGELVTARGGALARLALRNVARNPGRSSLTIGLVAAATFLIVAISAFRLDPPESYARRDSGSGGFALVAESDPLFYDLNSPAGRAELGFSPADEKLLASTKTFSFRVRAGDDASCLNLYQSQQPRILGAPAEFVARGGFAWGGHLGDVGPDGNVWKLLAAGGASPTATDAVPVVMDFNTATYSLHKGLGDLLSMTGDDGRNFQGQIVGLLKNSIFQGDVLMSEPAFLKHFPDQSGYRYFLTEAGPAAPLAEVEQTLRRGLYQKGFECERTDIRLAEFMTVQNTYLSTFQSLGGLGLLLGTLGLAVVQLRNVLERRGELALLRATGFRRETLARLVTLENAALLIGGLLQGLLAALVAVLPHVLAGGASIPWRSLAATLALVLVVGLLAGLLAVRATLRAPLLPALRGD